MRNKINKIFSSICPVKVPSHVAYAVGYLDEALLKIGVQHIPLAQASELPRSTHFDHNHPHFLRDGANVPPIWARSNGADTVVVGAHFTKQRLSILVRDNSNIKSIDDLRGRAVGIPKRDDKIDFFRVVAHRMLLVALENNKMNPSDVQWHDIEAAKSLVTKKTGSIWSGSGDGAAFYREEMEALLSGKIDAIFLNGSRAASVLGAGKVRSIYELQTDPYTRVNGSDPTIVTASGELARNHPEIVIKYLESAIRGASWARSHPEETIDIFANGLFESTTIVKQSFPQDLHQGLEPILSPSVLTALDIQQKFMFEHGYSSAPVDITKWVDDQFLKAALFNLQQTGAA